MAPLTGPNYIVKLTLDKCEISAQVDTGSVVSLVTSDFVKNVLKKNIRPMSELGDVETKFITANGDLLVYVGFITCSMRLQNVSGVFEVILLVVPNDGPDNVLLGTNVLSLLNSHIVKDSSLLHCVNLCKKFQKFGFVKMSSKRVITRNTVQFATARLQVEPAPFIRTVLLTPTNSAEAVNRLQFANICCNIPANESSVEVPFKVANSSTQNITLRNQFPVYNVSNIEKIGSADTDCDPRKATLPDDDFLDLFDIDFNDYSLQQQQQIKTLLLKYKKLFALNSHQLGKLEGFEYHIDLVDNTPVKQRYRPVHPRYYDKLQAQLQVMLQTGVIKECTSPWASPITIAEKADGDIRICIDFRVVNSKCKKDAKPIPRIDEVLQWLAGNSFFSCTDLMSGYWQVPLDKESQELTAFTAGSEQLYSFQRVPFGHTSSGNFFQRAMEDVLKSLIFKHCIVYLDDICIISKDFDGHCKSVDLVFDRLMNSGLKLKPKKCKLFKRQLKFLGHLVTEEGIKCDPEKTQLIRDWEEPKSTRDCRRFLGVIGYYRKFVSDFSRRAAPITDLLKGKTVKRGSHRKFVPVPFVWGEAQRNSFLDLKQTLLDDIVLMYPDYSRGFILEIDASRAGYGAVLSQEIDGKRRPVAFGSRKTSLPETAYPAHKLEFAALRWAVCQRFREYLHHSTVDIYTDSNPVVYILKKMEIDAVSQRWCAELARYDFKIHYRSGKTNTVADSLSRMTEPAQVDKTVIKKWCEDLVVSEHDTTYTTNSVKVLVNPVVKALLSSCSDSTPVEEQCYVSSEQNQTNNRETESDVLDKVDLIVDCSDHLNLQSLQDNDDNIQFVIRHIVSNPNITYKDVRDQSHFVKNLFKKRDRLLIEDGLLYKQRAKNGVINKQIVVNDSCVDVFIDMYHNKQSHLGQERTLSLIADRFYWPRMVKDVSQAVRLCTTCSARKVKHSINKTQMFHRPLPKCPMDVISMDHLTIDSRDGQLKVLTIVDEYSKYLWIIPVKRENAAMTVDAILNNVFLKYGMPNIIHSDQGKAFNNRLVQKLVKTCGIQQTLSTPGWSQGNPIAERCNSVILDMLGTLRPAEKTRWHRHCDYIAYSYNTSIHTATGFSPYFLMYGRHPRLIGDALLNVKMSQPSHDSVDRFVSNLRKAYANCTRKLEQQRTKYKKYYDGKIFRNVRNLKPDDIVLVKNERPFNKIDDRWKADPHIVVCQPNVDIPVYKVKDMETNAIRNKHRNQLLPVYRAERIVPPVKQRQQQLRKEKRIIAETSEYDTCESESESASAVRLGFRTSGGDADPVMSPSDAFIHTPVSHSSSGRVHQSSADDVTPNNQASDVTSPSEVDSSSEEDNVFVPRRSRRKIKFTDRYSPSNYP